jgi:hypothetical protein
MEIWPTQPPTQWVPGDLWKGKKWPGHEADHSPPSSCEVYKSRDIRLLPYMPSWRTRTILPLHCTYVNTYVHMRSHISNASQFVFNKSNVQGNDSMVIIILYSTKILH